MRLAIDEVVAEDHKELDRRAKRRAALAGSRLLSQRRK